MESVKVCPTCRHENPGNVLFCACGASLLQVPRTGPRNDAEADVTVVAPPTATAEFVKVCPVCGQENALATMVCGQCGTSLTAARKTPRERVAEPTEPGAKEEQSPELGRASGGDLVCPDCQHSNPLGTTNCQRCFCRLRTCATPLSDGRQVPLVVVWPWGEAALSGRLGIGRDNEFSPLASHLETYPNLSRRHAEIYEEGGVFFLRDINSTNGTFVNDRPLPPHTHERLEAGMILRFGRHLKVTVRSSR
jgi:hypothetical protein